MSRQIEELQNQIDVLQQKCEVLKEGSRLLGQELRTRLEDIEDLNRETETPLVQAIQNLQLRMVKLEQAHTH